VLKDRTKEKRAKRAKLRTRIRAKIKGTAERPRIFLFKSNRYVYTQAVDDLSGKVLVAASSLEKEFKKLSKNTKNKKACEVLGGLLAKRLKDKKIASIVFDRGIYPYHGRVKTLADVVRKEGISF